MHKYYVDILTIDLPCPLLKMLTPERALPIEELRVNNAQPEKRGILCK